MPQSKCKRKHQRGGGNGKLSDVGGKESKKKWQNVLI